MTEQPTRIGALEDGQVDPDLAPVGADEQQTPRQAVDNSLAAALATDASRPPVTIVIPARSTIAVEFDTNITDEQVTAWRMRARNDKAPDGVDQMKLCCIVLGNQCRKIYVGGNLQTSDTAGTPLTFASPEVREMLSLPNGTRVAQTIRKFIGNDPHVLGLANEVMEKAGYGDVIVSSTDGTDPTQLV